MPTAEVNGARLWYEEAGEGPAVVLVHGGLGDARLWEPEFGPLAEQFRTIRFDQRFFGRSTGPAAPFSFVDDVVGLLDVLAVTRAALVGLSFGGRSSSTRRSRRRSAAGRSSASRPRCPATTATP